MNTATVSEAHAADMEGWAKALRAARVKASEPFTPEDPRRPELVAVLQRWRPARVISTEDADAALGIFRDTELGTLYWTKVALPAFPPPPIEVPEWAESHRLYDDVDETDVVRFEVSREVRSNVAQSTISQAFRIDLTTGEADPEEPQVTISIPGAEGDLTLYQAQLEALQRITIDSALHLSGRAA